MLRRYGVSRGLLSLPDAVSLSLIGVLLVILLAVNPPLLVDDFYHLSVSRQIYTFGFIPTWDFWEFAPMGRPHLYPPLLHLVMAFLMKASGGDVLLAAKVVKVSVYPLLLLLFWFSVRELAGRETALYSTLTLASASPLLLLATMIMPATLVLAITPPLLLSFIKRRILTSALLLSAAMWLHVSMPLTVVATLLAFSLVRRDGYPKLFVKVASISTLTYLPWLLHVASHAGWLTPTQASGLPFIPFTVWLLALPSIASTLRHKDSGCLAFLLYALSLTLLIGYTTRFSVYLLLPASFFTGLTLSRIRWNRRKLKAALILILAASFLTVTPAIGGSPQTMDPFQPGQPPPPELASILSHPLLSPSPLLTLALWPPYLRGPLTPTTLPIYAASTWLAINSPGIVCYVGLDSSHAAAVTALTGLPTSSGMWREAMSPWTLVASWWFTLNQASVYIVEAPFTAPPSNVPCMLALDLGPVKVFVRD